VVSSGYAVAVKPVGRSWRRVYVNAAGKPRWTREGNRGILTSVEASRVQRWARLRGMRFRSTSVNPYPHLVGDVDANRDLLLKLNRGGARLRKQIRIRRGRRTIAEQQELYALYQAGRGPLAAVPNPMAPHVRGVAADCGIDGVNIGAWHGAREAMEAEGLCLPVKGENWHVEIGETWRA